jgi:hypothetical protein
MFPIPITMSLFREPTKKYYSEAPTRGGQIVTQQHLSQKILSSLPQRCANWLKKVERERAWREGERDDCEQRSVPSAFPRTTRSSPPSAWMQKAKSWSSLFFFFTFGPQIVAQGSRSFPGGLVWFIHRISIQ